jgi:hypothetical protein
VPAPLTLLQAEEQPGFTDGLLNILEQEQNPSLRLSSKQILPPRVPDPEC